jgi:hypothetical protein
LERALAEVAFKLDYYSVGCLPRVASALNPIYKPVVTALGIAGMHIFLRVAFGSAANWPRAFVSAFGCECARQRNLDARSFDKMTAQHISGRNDFSAEINAVMNVESIERELLRAWQQD